MCIMGSCHQWVTIGKKDIYLLPAKKVKEKRLDKSGRCGCRHQSMDGTSPAAKVRQHQNPATAARGGVLDKSETDRPQNYLRERLDAFSGLTFWALSAMLVLTWVARLQLPFFHLLVGSGQAEQYHPEAISRVRLQPLHCSTISWQTPPLYPQPLAVMKAHSWPLRTVVHFIEKTSQYHFGKRKGQRARILRPF
jgi:hypothetical protein